MRASRLLRILLLLQNRGRLTSRQLATELEVVSRTILRDVDALTEAGLPIIVHQGNQGGIELGFDYRTRLTGLAADEAEAMAIILTRPFPELSELGMGEAGQRARSKLLEAFPDTCGWRWSALGDDSFLRRCLAPLPTHGSAPWRRPFDGRPSCASKHERPGPGRFIQSRSSPKLPAGRSWMRSTRIRRSQWASGVTSVSRHARLTATEGDDRLDDLSALGIVDHVRDERLID